MKIVIVSGGFDPVHVGHIRMFKKAKELGDKLIIILNNDEFLARKKGHVFMPFEQRKEVLESIRYIDVVFGSFDKDDSVSESLKAIRNTHIDDEMVFANGGDRDSNQNIRESETCENLKIELVFGVGGTDKPQSSSWLANSIKRRLVSD
ncbi:adenylyltransferase/cytidyltransferase family protein [Chloroflexota bacterium]